jgi:segregation and condensation protein B
MENIPAIIEALILAAEAPLALEKISAVLDGVDKNEVKEAVDRLIADYDERGSGICIQEVAGGYQFRTRPVLAVWVKKLKGAKPAIVAYRQPIVKAEIESIRGVDVSAPLKGLMEKKLVRIVGRKDVPGKPIIYGTTKRFLEVFNLKELTDLPTMRELREITEHQEVYEQETIDFAPDEQDGPNIEDALQMADAVQAPQAPSATDDPDLPELQDAWEPLFSPQSQEPQESQKQDTAGGQTIQEEACEMQEISVPKDGYEDETIL